MRGLFVAVLGFCLAGCSTAPTRDYLPQTSAPAPKTSGHAAYSFGVPPLHNPVRLFESYEPVIDEINSRAAGFTLRLETARDYPAYEAKVRDRKLDFLMMNSHLVIPAEDRGYRIIGRTADTIRGVILVRRGSPIRRVRDLKGASVSFPSRTDLPGAMMPKLFLKQSGLDVDREATPKNVGSPDSAVMNVYTSRSAAACISESAWRSFQSRRPELAKALEVRWETSPLIGLGILARNDLPREHVQSVARSLFELNETATGRKLLASVNITSFVFADEATYDRVWEFLNEYRRAFGYIPTLQGPE